MSISYAYAIGTAIISPTQWARDLWLEQYADYVARESLRLGAGAMGKPYLSAIRVAYRAYQISGRQRDQFNTWAAINIAADWLSQL
jgi:hypothetical protein